MKKWETWQKVALGVCVALAVGVVVYIFWPEGQKMVRDDDPLIIVSQDETVTSIVSTKRRPKSYLAFLARQLEGQAATMVTGQAPAPSVAPQPQPTPAVAAPATVKVCPPLCDPLNTWEQQQYEIWVGSRPRSQ